MMMTDPDTNMSKPEQNALLRRLPLIAILAVAVIGAFTLRDYLSFETLAQNREALLAFRDANYLLTVGVFIAAYVVIVGFSLPGATIATLTGGLSVRDLSGCPVQRDRCHDWRDGDLSGRPLGAG